MQVRSAPAEQVTQRPVVFAASGASLAALSAVSHRSTLKKLLNPKIDFKCKNDREVTKQVTSTLSVLEETIDKTMISIF